MGFPKHSEQKAAANQESALGRCTSRLGLHNGEVPTPG